MRVLTALRQSFWQAVRFIWPLLAIHAAIGLLSAAIIVPLTAMLLNFGIAFSDQPSLTDQDIAWFFLSPGGLVFFLVIASVLITAGVLEFTVMTLVLHAQRRSARAALRTGFARVVPKIPILLGFALRLTLRVLLIALPFLAVAGLVAWRFLSEFDINYYLAERPPEFFAAAILIGAAAIALAVLLTHKLLDWAMSVQLILFQGLRGARVFAASRELMRGRRMGLLAKLLGWAGLRALAGMAVASLGAAIVALITPWVGGSLLTAIAVVTGAVGVTILIDAVVSTIANGMLAALLYRLYDDASGGVAPEPAGEARMPAGLPLRGLSLGAIAIVVAGVAGGALILDNVQAEDTTAVIAHRGAAGARPENTMASVEEAIRVGADWIEIDVQETADGEVVVLHDSDFMKLSGVDLKIWNATRADLDQIDIGSWFDPVYADQRIPGLREVLLAAKDRAKVLIELKYYGHDQMLESRVSDIITETGMAEQIAVMSLKYSAVQKMHQLRPDLRVGVLAARAAGDLTRLEGEFIAVNTGMVSARLIRATHKAGKQIYVWTVNDPLQMSRLISMGVDGLITDEPALAREVLAHRAELNTPQRLLLWLTDRLGLAPEGERTMRDDSP
ncbi:glycerophosphodiester phosphodiesterase [Rhodobacteraceae bacterium NNCM2]|nr:glycerophosphodiester phosphodiesterase [Coraliihabitans acroporae]